MKPDAPMWVAETELLGHRWDPGFWDPALRDPLAACAVPVAELGDFIPAKGITYGRIQPGRKPPAGPGPLYVTQRAVRPTGFDPTACETIAEGCAWDGPRYRLRRGDLLIPRSGVATLARGLMALFLDERPAVVDCFVDRVTLQGYDPRVAVLTLRVRPVWLQIHRLINGVGPPNLSYDEIRSLQLPVFPGDLAAAIARRHARMHGAHQAWVARVAAVRASGGAPDRDRHAAELRRRAERLLRGAVAVVEQAISGN